MVLAPSNPANETYGYCRNAFGHNTYLYRKFTPEYDMDGLIADRFHSPVNFPIIRYADVLLMLAECYNETSNLSGAVEFGQSGTGTCRDRTFKFRSCLFKRNNKRPGI